MPAEQADSFSLGHRIKQRTSITSLHVAAPLGGGLNNRGHSAISNYSPDILLIAASGRSVYFIF